MNRLTVTSVEAANNRLKISFSCRGQIRKFFERDKFIVEYDTSIETVPEAILIIPFLATVSPIAWADNADIFVETVDKIFLESLVNIKKTFQRFYPRMNFSGKIHARNSPTTNVRTQTRRMMLFSGGVDSIATYIWHQDENPILATIKEKDFASVGKRYHEGKRLNISVDYLGKFYGMTKSEHRLIKSNYTLVPSDFMLSQYEEKLSGHWYIRVMYGLASLGLCAPLTYVDKVGKLYIASGHEAGALIPNGSHPDLDNNVRWTGTTVEHKGAEYSRQEKVTLIADYIKSENPKLQLITCINNVNGENCGFCEKCARTILGLELAGVNPNEHGFSVEADAFLRFKRSLLSGEWKFGIDEEHMWSDLQKHANSKKKLPNPEAREFIDWLLKVDLKTLETRPERRRLALPLLTLLPYSIYKIAKRAYLTVAEMRLR